VAVSRAPSGGPVQAVQQQQQCSTYKNKVSLTKLCFCVSLANRCGATRVCFLTHACRKLCSGACDQACAVHCSSMHQLTVGQALHLALAALGALGAPAAKRACCLQQGAGFGSVAAVTHRAACATRLRGACAAPSSVGGEVGAAGGAGASCAAAAAVGGGQHHVKHRVLLEHSHS
jgi:hypothetical protein